MYACMYAFMSVWMYVFAYVFLHDGLRACLINIAMATVLDFLSCETVAWPSHCWLNNIASQGTISATGLTVCYHGYCQRIAVAVYPLPNDLHGHTYMHTCIDRTNSAQPFTRTASKQTEACKRTIDNHHLRSEKGPNVRLDDNIRNQLKT